MTSVQMVEIEAALQRVARKEADHNDANLLRALFQQLINEVRQLSMLVDASNQPPEVCSTSNPEQRS